ncbi:MAG: hypothetical protein R3D84_05480 [Paracoccaceae bacterium]
MTIVPFLMIVVMWRPLVPKLIPQEGAISSASPATCPNVVAKGSQCILPSSARRVLPDPGKGIKTNGAGAADRVAKLIAVTQARSASDNPRVK